MSNGTKAVVTLVCFYVLAVTCAFVFSGSVTAALTAIPVSIVGGLLAGYYATRD